MTDLSGGCPLELWGGIECTINRLGNRFVDQLELVGGYSRTDLVEKMAAVGFKKVRWPALWEHTAPDGLRHADWRWCDATLPLLHDHGIEPIVGLVHHGSGPASTDLLDAQFGDKLAEYAAAFASRYPWVRLYTPINEPLTTARFSALYGHWYPHRRDDSAFVAALINQTRATIKAMAAIRAVTPDAELVCTEDAGSTRGTDAVAAQARFEDERRWLSLDLLTGRVSDGHFLWPYLRGAGMSIDDRHWFARHAVSPSIIGLNYYVTSDRFLDHHVERYPSAVQAAMARCSMPMSRPRGSTGSVFAAMRRCCLKRGIDTVCHWPSPRRISAAPARSRCDGFVMPGSARSRLAASPIIHSWRVPAGGSPIRGGERRRRR